VEASCTLTFSAFFCLKVVEVLSKVPFDVMSVVSRKSCVSMSRRVRFEGHVGMTHVVGSTGGVGTGVL
jgi:hypothetical protein